MAEHAAGARPPLEAVLLDAGGVLVRLDFEWMAETLTRLGAPMTAEALRRAEVTGRRWYDASKGHPPGPGEPAPPLGATGDTNAYFKGMLNAAGVPDSLVPAVMEPFMERQKAVGLWGRPNEGARAMIDALVRWDVHRAVVSNSDGRAEQHLIDCGVRDGLEFVIDSQLVGVEKPDPRIFRLALDRLSVDAARTLFVGDILCVDAAGARAAGLNFVLIDRFGDYGPPGLPSIPDIGSLPEYLDRHFTIVPIGAAERRASAGRAGGGS